MPRQSKTVLVTGATGFTGGRLAEVLGERGDDVRVLVRPGREDALPKRTDLEVCIGDLTDAGSLDAAVKGVDVVYHVAAAFREAKLSDEDYTAVNVSGTENLVRAAAAARVGRFVHCSTIGVHGDTGRIPASEEAPFDPPDHYCVTKLEGELLARRLFKELALPGVVFRPLGIYGPGDTRFLKLFRALSRRKFLMIGNGETLYHMTYIDDLCAGIILCGEHPRAPGEVFILGGKGHTTLDRLVQTIKHAVQGAELPFRIPMWPVMMAAQLCESICRPLGIEPPLYPRRVEFFSKDRAADISKAENTLGFRPDIDLKEGCERTAKWYKDAGLI